MARYTGSKVKLSKRVNRNLFNKGARSFSAKDDYSKRPQKPGQHGNSRRFPRLSQYGKQLTQKQTIKFTYGIMEKPFANLFKKAFKKSGKTGTIVLTNLERRLDNVVYRGGLANSRSQARQLVNHGHFLVNGVKTNIPSFMVDAGDVVTVKENKIKRAFWTSFQLTVPNETPTWLDKSKKNTLKVINLPLETDLPADLEIGLVVEYYSRKVR
jgi:small subunit ribosomal protein S4